MGLNGYLEQVYRWVQAIYSSERMERLTTAVHRWLQARTIGELIRWLGKTALWVLIIGLVLDAILYWTREDQVSFVRRIWRALYRLVDRLVGGRDSTDGPASAQ